MGLWVLGVRPRRPANLALALFCVGYGGFFIFGNLRLMVTQDDPARPLLSDLMIATSLTAMAALFSLAALLPRPMRRREIPLVIPGLALWAVSSFATVLATDSAANPLRLFLGLVSSTSLGFLLGGTLLLIALRALVARSTGAALKQAILMTAGILLFPAFGAGRLAMTLVRDRDADLGNWVVGAVGVLAALVLLAVWLVISGRSAPPESRMARNVALLGPGMVVVGALTVQVGVDAQSGIFGLVRLVMAGFLVYAILRQQLLGLDLRVKWTIRQSTVAAAFVGVFFVVSESAASFFQSEGGLGTYLGIGAAGLLVFAMAPLQRVAERVASAAMPGVKAVGEMSGDERAAVYLAQARAAWADGSLDRSERALLDSLRGQLRLGAEEALALDREAAKSAGA